MQWLIDLIYEKMLAAGFATQAWVLAKVYATEAWVIAKNYATQIWVVSRGYATMLWVLAHNYASEAWVEAKGYLTAGYVNRGDPGGYDYAAGDFTKDSAWHVKDLSSIVPAGTKAVLMRWRIQNNGSGKLLALTKNGNTHTYNSSRTYTQVSNIYRDTDLRCTVDEDRKMKYYFTSGGWIRADMVVRGWWL